MPSRPETRYAKSGELSAGSSRALNIQIRAGPYTGECELMQDKIGGIAVWRLYSVVDA